MTFTKTKYANLNEEVWRGLASDGMRVIVVPKNFSKTYALVGVNYGSIDDIVDGEIIPDGVAHFLEHKLFEQPDGTNAFDLFAQTGAMSNAYTSFTQTCYLFSVTSNIKENLKHLLNFVKNPYFTEENVAKEQGIIAQEIKMYQDEPHWRVFFNLLGLMYPNDPMAKDIAGTVESIASITPEILYKCYNHYYKPQNMVLVLVGSITEAELESI